MYSEFEYVTIHKQDEEEGCSCTCIPNQNPNWEKMYEIRDGIYQLGDKSDTIDVSNEDWLKMRKCT